jgi:serine/threonine-protein kinase
VPDLANMTLDQATAALAELRLNVQQATPVFSDTVPAGAVLEQNPAAGTQVPRDSTVGVRISRGPDLRRVPRLEGATLRQARQRLRERGLQVGRLLGSRQGVVVEASVNGNPVARGDQLPRGTPVDLVLF